MLGFGVRLLLLWFRGVLVCFGVGPWRCGARKVGVLAARHASLLESSRVECESPSPVKLSAPGESERRKELDRQRWKRFEC